MLLVEVVGLEQRFPARFIRLFHFDYCLALLDEVWAQPPLPADAGLVTFDCKYASPCQVLVALQQLLLIDYIRLITFVVTV